MIKLGSSDMAKAYVGSTEVSKMYLGSDLVWGGNAIDGHQLSQIRMPYGSYLNTDYLPSNSTKVEFGIIPLYKSNWGTLCIAKESNNAKQYSVLYSSYVNTIHLYCGTNIYDNTKNVDLRPLTHYDVVFSKPALIVNGTSYSYNQGQDFVSPNPLCVNGYIDSSAVFAESLYDYFKVYDGNTLMRDYIPWMRENGTVGMLDLLHNKFYASASSVNFTDNSISLPNGYTRLNYISATGAQRFQTDFIPTNKTNYIVKCRFTGNSAFKSILSSRYSSSSRRFELMSGATNNPNTELYFGYNNGSDNLTITDYGGKEFCAVKGENYIYYYIDGVFNSVRNRTSGTFTAPKTLTIGCSNTNGTYTNWFVGDIIELDFFENGHYIPCISPNNVVGMYDVINNVFKSSDTNTQFVAGTVYGQ